MNVRRAPGIGHRLDGAEAVGAIRARDGAAVALEGLVARAPLERAHSEWRNIEYRNVKMSLSLGSLAVTCMMIVTGL